MPEGDSVHRQARLLDGALSGHRLIRTDFRVPRIATADLTGGAVTETVARGKHLLTRIAHDREWTLHTHLKMEGTWRVLEPGRRWPRPAHLARVVLATETAQAVGFELGTVELLPTAEEHRVVGHLGPDLLGPDWDPDEAVRRLLAAPDRPLAPALLDQSNLAGIGNVYASELCFVTGMHPTAPVGDAELPVLVQRAREMLRANLGPGRRTTTGSRRERLWVYRRDRQPCRRCGTPVRVLMLGEAGRERSTYFCPDCQPAR